MLRSNFISIFNTLHKSVPVGKSLLRIYVEVFGDKFSMATTSSDSGKGMCAYIYRHNERIKAAKCK